MSVLTCDFSNFATQKENLKKLVEDYNLIIKNISTLESDTNLIWESQAQKVYYEKIIERKAELEQLSLYYSEMIEFLETTLNGFKSIEDKYS